MNISARIIKGVISYKIRNNCMEVKCELLAIYLGLTELYFGNIYVQHWLPCEIPIKYIGINI